MELQKITLPLPADVSRCLGHNGRLGNTCPKRDECARHLTISHRKEPWTEVKAPYYRMCSDDNYLSFLGCEK